MDTKTAPTVTRYGRTFTNPIEAPSRTYLVQFVPAGSRPIHMWSHYTGNVFARDGIVIHDLTHAAPDHPLGQPVHWGGYEMLTRSHYLSPFQDNSYWITVADFQAMNEAVQAALGANPYTYPAPDPVDSLREGVGYGHNESLREAVRALRSMVAVRLMTADEAIEKLDSHVPPLEGENPTVRIVAHDILRHS